MSNNASINRSWTLPPAGIVLATIGVGFFAVFLGLASAILPWWFVIGLVLLITAITTAVAVPELGVVLMLLMVCGVVPERFSPNIPLGAGNIKLHELMIGLMSGVALVHLRSQSSLAPFWRWLRPIFGIGLLTLSATTVGVLLFGTPIKEALNDARNQYAWLVLLPVIGIIRTRRHVTRFQWWITAVGVVVALLALVQFFTGISIVQNARVEDLNTLNSTDPEMTRSIVGASIYFSVFGILLILGKLLTKSMNRTVGILLLVVLMAGMVVTFGRGVWLTTMLAVIASAFLLRKWYGVFNVVIVGSLGLTVALGGLAIYKPHVVSAAYERFASTGSEKFSRNTSLGWRLEETNSALEIIYKHPILGIGMGTSYKPVIRMNGRTVTEQDVFLTKYIHNAYLGMWLKFGFVAPILVFLIIIGIVRRGRKFWSSTSDINYKVISITIVVAFLVPVATSITQPEWLSQSGIAFFSLMIGLQVAMYRSCEDAKILNSNNTLNPHHLAYQSSSYRFKVHPRSLG